MYPTPTVRLLLLLIALALLCAAPGSAWAAPTITWYRVLHSTILNTNMSGDTYTYWSQQVGIRVHPESPDIGLAAVTVTVSGVTYWNCTDRWPANDGTGDECFCTYIASRERPAGGSYTLSACDWYGQPSNTVTTPELTRFLEPAPEITAPVPASAISETSPTITWPVFPGFTGEGAPPVNRQGVGVSSDSDGTCLWRFCERPPGETSATYTGEPLAAGQAYEARLWEMAPDVSLDGPVPGVYCEQNGRVWDFAVSTPVPVIQWMYVDRGPVLDWNGWSSHFEEVGLSVSDSDGVEDIASVTVTDSRGQAHAADLRSVDSPTVAQYWWPAWGQEEASPAGTYSVIVTDREGHTDSASGVVTELPPDLPVIVTPEADYGLTGEAPVFSWTAPEGAGCFCMGVAEQDAWPGSTWSPPGPVTSPLPYEGDALLPGHVYDWFLNYHVFDGVQADSRVTCRVRPTVTGRFTVYSPVPVIENASICRGRCLCIDPGSTESLHEGAWVTVRDFDGWQDVSVSTVTPDGLVLPDVATCDGSFNDGLYTLTQANARNPASVGEGSYAITATDTAGNTVSLISGHVSAGVPGRHEITSPANNAVLPEGDLTPTFSWTGSTGAAYTCICVKDRGASDAVIWARRNLPGDITSVVYNDDGTATVPQLSPGGRYRVGIRVHYPDEDPDDGVAVDIFTGGAANFSVYSPLPVIDSLWVGRGRDTAPEGTVSYHERTIARVSDMDDDITSVVITDSRAIAHDAYFESSTGDWRWEVDGEAGPVPAGAYTVTVTDAKGYVATASAQTSEIPDTTPVIEGPPANDSIASAIPTFSWSGPADTCYCMGVGEADAPCKVWCGGRQISGSGASIVYNDNGTADQPQLTPSHLYGWWTTSMVPDPAPQTDSRCVSEFGSTARGRFWVEPKLVGFLEPINDDGSSVFKLGSIVPVKFQLVKADGGQVTDAICELHLAKVTDSVTGTEVEVVSAGAADSGSTFRYATDHYQFNLNTKVLSTGTYRLWVTINGDVVHEATISLQ